MEAPDEWIASLVECKSPEGPHSCCSGRLGHSKTGIGWRFVASRHVFLNIELGLYLIAFIHPSVVN